MKDIDHVHGSSFCIRGSIFREANFIYETVYFKYSLLDYIAARLRQYSSDCEMHCFSTKF